MSLYNDASLVMIPSAYKDGKLYSIKPTDGSGDFTFSRGSNLAATRVNSSGLIEKGRENLLLQSNGFDVGANWAKSSSITLTSGQSGYDGTSDAYLLESDGSSVDSVLQSVSCSGVNTCSIYAKAGTNSIFSLRASGVDARATFDLSAISVSTNSQAIDASIEQVGTTDWYRCSMYFNGAASYVLIYPNDISAPIVGSIYIQDAQLEVGLVATDYIETTTTTAQAGILEDMPRLDYSGGASCPSLLLEPQRTNALNHSEYFGSSYWTKSGDVTLTSNYGISPEGVQNADRLVADTSSGGHNIYRLITTTGTHTISIFAKASGYNYTFLGYNGGNLNFGIVFNLSNGTISQNPAGLTGTIEAVGSDGWYRCTLTRNYTASGYIVVSPHDNSGAYTWTGNGTDGILIWGAMAEFSSSYASSYIPTYGTSQTRAQDQSSNAFLNNLQTNNILSNSGTFFWQCDLLGVNAVRTIFNLDDDIGFVSLADGRTAMRYNSFGTYSGLANRGSNEFKISIVYTGLTAKLFINGSLIDSVTLSTTITPNDLSIFNSSFGRGLPQVVKQIIAFPTALTDSECIALTTL